MISRLGRALLSVLGIPEDEDAAFYGQLALNLVFCVAAFGAFARIAFDRADRAFWICLLIALLALLASRDKRVPIATFAVLLATRFAFAGLMYALRG